MVNRPFMVPITVIILVLATVAGASAGTTEKHSGTVVAIDSQTGSLTIAEVGPSPGAAGKSQIIEQTFALTRTTAYAVFRRVNVSGKFAGDFVEVALEATDVAIGDQATVECTRQGGRLVALKVALADPTSPPAAAAAKAPPELKPVPSAAAAMPRLPVTEQTAVAPSGSQSREQPEVVRPGTPAASTAPDPRAVIDWLLHPATR
jgi:hypothetical protein